MELGLKGPPSKIFSSPTLIICWAWTTLKIWAQSDLVEFCADFGFFDPLFGQKLIFGLGGVKFFITNHDHLLGLNYPESLSSIGLGWVLGWFSGFLTPFFGQKSIFGLGGVKFFIPNLDHLLGLNYPESLSSIGLMVEAVDTFCGTGMGTGMARQGTGTAGDYIDNLSPSFCLTWLGFGLGWGLSI